jgi:outer membrane immunogenic protein
MKKVLLGGVALITLGFVGTAVAADMPLKAPPPPVAVNTWTGYYAGVDIGGIEGANESMYFNQSSGVGALGGVHFDPVTMNNSNHWGATGGIYAGDNWAVTPSWVVGVEGDWDKASLGNTSVNSNLTAFGLAQPISGCAASAPPVGGAICNGVGMSDNLSWIATVRGRLGYTVGSMMVYATGGGAWASLEYSGQVNPALLGTTPPAVPPNLTGAVGSIATSFNTIRTGWVVGGGVELMATANWLVRIEYLHYQFGSGAAGSAACTLCTAGADGRFSGAGNFAWGSPSFDSVRAGLAYKF